MALILEIRDPRGHRTWHRLDHLPLSIGRALSNDVILDDPYADAVHARILIDDAGVTTIEDGGSVNGMSVGGIRSTASVPLSAGLELRLGRTTLRVHSTDEPVAPALPDTAPAARWKSWAMHTKAGRLSVTGAMFAMIALNTWLGNTEESSGTAVFTMLLGSSLLLLLWAGVWSAAARGADRRFNFGGHLAVASIVVLALIAYTVLIEWLSFLFPDSGVLTFVGSVVMLAAVAWAVAAHLAVPNLLTPRKRWRAGLVVSGVVLALVGIGALVDTDDFSDVPSFESQLKQMPVALVPSSTTEQFLDVMREVKERADEAARTSQRTP